MAAHARLLRDHHHAVRGFTPPAGTTFADGGFAVGHGDLVCHGDFGPWNVVWDGIVPVGPLDWDCAIVAPPLHDVAYAIEFAAPLRSDEEAMRWLRYDRPPDRHSLIDTA